LLGGWDVGKRYAIIAEFRRVLKPLIVIDIPDLVCGGACISTFSTPYDYNWDDIADRFLTERDTCGRNVYLFIIHGKYVCEHASLRVYADWSVNLMSTFHLLKTIIPREVGESLQVNSDILEMAITGYLSHLVFLSECDGILHVPGDCGVSSSMSYIVGAMAGREQGYGNERVIEQLRHYSQGFYENGKIVERYTRRLFSRNGETTVVNVVDDNDPSVHMQISVPIHHLMQRQKSFFANEDGFEYSCNTPLALKQIKSRSSLKMSKFLGTRYASGLKPVRCGEIFEPLNHHRIVPHSYMGYLSCVGAMVPTFCNFLFLRMRTYAHLRAKKKKFGSLPTVG